MPKKPDHHRIEATASIPQLPERALLLDLETNPGAQTLLEIGACVGSEKLSLNPIRSSNKALHDLASIASNATCVVGHNIWKHDLPVIAALAPGHPVTRLPIIDTLLLSPLAFPENPYHRLVKDYKLVSETRNNPVADAQLSGKLLCDQITSFSGLSETDARCFSILRSLLCRNGTEKQSALELGFDWVFKTIAPHDSPLLSDQQIVENLHAWIPGFACRMAAQKLSLDDLDLRESRHALAYTVAWLRVAGANSVIPSWVRHTYPQVSEWIDRLRDQPCEDSECEYCKEMHNPVVQLKRLFDFDSFHPTPVNTQGGSLQQDITSAGMRNESLLAILPTGGGKSLCFQLPALIRHIRRGALTIVISPLQALMKDQVDSLQRMTGSSHVAALYGMLTAPERGDILERVRYGDIAILYVSPEQLRNPSFRKTIMSREIGCWVFDEAHCLSKWGHDFRPDYLYAGRFIHEFARDTRTPLPPVACFTATAKLDVIEEIRQFFHKEANVVLQLFEGGTERQNLRFRVEPTTQYEKNPRIHELLTEYLDAEGAGIVFVSTRKASVLTAEFLVRKGWRAAAFHAGLPAPEKKRIQDDFIQGALQVICATNAFGMGVDKKNVRLVIHSDTPGSLENYIQEAGRAGRDQQPADCVLLYDEADCERQFQLGAFSELTRKDLAQLLRGIRRAKKKQSHHEVIITTGELLRDEDLALTFQAGDYGADTRVRTGIAWLERAGFLERNDNQNRVFQARLLVASMQEAVDKISPLDLQENMKHLWLDIISHLMNADVTTALSSDDIAQISSFKRVFPPERTEQGSTDLTSKFVFQTLSSMASAGILKKDTILNAFVRHKVRDHSLIRLEKIIALETAFLKTLMEEDPDPEGWVSLQLSPLNHRLHADGYPECQVEHLIRILKSISMDGRGFAGSTGSIELRPTGKDVYRIRLHRDWQHIQQLSMRRHRIADVILKTLTGTIPPNTAASASYLCEFHFEQLEEAIHKTPELSSPVKDNQVLIERGLMFLHEQQVIILQQGLAIFRSAMTLRILAEGNGIRYTRDHYLPLEQHYEEKKLQIHVMSEYARFGMEKIEEALQLVLAYFQMDRTAFLKTYFTGRDEEISRATTAKSYQTIVENLGNREQQRIVQAPIDRNMLILAGPGSGKTRTVVHRCAFLLRVKRVPARSILICCFNRTAAVELRKRLIELVGKDAGAVTIQTYHGLAMRLLGLSYRTLCERDETANLDNIIPEATRLLKGSDPLFGIEADELRERLLAGYQHILVDEYQDIDQAQYDLISAITGRSLNDEDTKLSILAVGDDDQNIYTFRGANVHFIHQFERDYGAETHYLVENYRSTRYIIDAANKLIKPEETRLKKDHPIRVNHSRELLPPGGACENGTPPHRGRVVHAETFNRHSQAYAVVSRLLELKQALPDTMWSSMAVLSRTTRELCDVRSLCEIRGIPVNWVAGFNKLPPLHRMKEMNETLERLEDHKNNTLSRDDLCEMLPVQDSPWSALVQEAATEWMEATQAELPVKALIETLYEVLIQHKQECDFGHGVHLRTIHNAKGMEYPHVIITGAWKHARKEIRSERRVLYVGMTRAMQTLAVFTPPKREFPYAKNFSGAAIHALDPIRNPESFNLFAYQALGLEDLYLDYAGTLQSHHAVHAGLHNLSPGDTLQVVKQKGGLFLHHDEQPVARLSTSCAERLKHRLPSIQSCRVLGLYVRNKTDVKDPTFIDRIQCDQWLLPMCEIVTRQS